jgi:hypothetical protein
MWEIEAKLNTLRNAVAHSLESPKRQKLTDELIELCRRELKDSDDFDNITEDKSEHCRMGYFEYLQFAFESVEEAQTQGDRQTQRAASRLWLRFHPLLPLC